MNQPTVCAVMLTADRPEYARRAVECFRAQTYPAKTLLIYDTGTDDAEDCPGDYPLVIWIPEESRGRTIGELRNAANSHVEGVEVDLSAGTSKDCGGDILIHWDSDDFSHPNRIAEQVALLQSSGAECVGYREMLFWRQIQKRDIVDGPEGREPGIWYSDGEAWLYTNPDPRYALGTSLCYWRKTWERKPFEALPTSATDSASEDARFIAGLNCVGVPAFGHDEPRVNLSCQGTDFSPRMIARIHAGNTSQAYDPRNMERSNKIKGGPWRRVPEWDAYARSVME